MKRWSEAYPGAAKVTHELGRFKTEDLAVQAFNHFLPRIAKIPQDQAHPLLRSLGYGDERKFWVEIHFATNELAERYQKDHGGQLWNCVGLKQEFKKSDAENVVREWVERHEAAVGKKILVDVIENTGSKLDIVSPNAYVYINNIDAAMMLKLALGGSV